MKDFAEFLSELLEVRDQVANHAKSDQLIAKQNTEVQRLKYSDSRHKQLSEAQEVLISCAETASTRNRDCERRPRKNCMNCSKDRRT
ncbi:uncharacterized protein EKO05_0008953 [Ascochyta rabiei]|uniref:uncharacterized protein n=1 Tax=Didymella rabiei TaxID=5454 RepID=UPI0021FD8BFD|nr:uncharacterized protein EKO05_0008953 [Ascochyta rabiei]UPX18661.1 hypothetical protein EKO05_0008953 [Ascochyta rabiei]